MNATQPTMTAAVSSSMTIVPTDNLPCRFTRVHLPCVGMVMKKRMYPDEPNTSSLAN